MMRSSLVFILIMPLFAILFLTKIPGNLLLFGLSSNSPLLSARDEIDCSKLQFAACRNEAEIPLVEDAACGAGLQGEFIRMKHHR